MYFLLDTAIPLGLIINELVANSLKYAFPENRGGEITISLVRIESGLIRFIYRDNGVGVPSDFDFRKKTTLGLKLIFSIAEEQMMGTIKIENSRGIFCIFEFNNNLYQARV